jgi:hypothetical protein
VRLFKRDRGAIIACVTDLRPLSDKLQLVDDEREKLFPRESDCARPRRDAGLVGPQTLEFTFKT